MIIGGGIKDDDIFTNFFYAVPGKLHVTIVMMEERHSRRVLRNQKSTDLTGLRLKEQF